jgi:hypothetical protein
MALNRFKRSDNCYYITNSFPKDMEIKLLKVLYFVFFSINCLAVYSQQQDWSSDSLSHGNPNIRMDRYRSVLRYHDPLMYAAFPVIEPIASRPAPLANGEGKNGYWLEGNFAYRFTLFQGKHYTYPLFQRLRPTLDFELTPRLTRDNSSPLLPINNKFGVGVDFLLSSLSGLSKEKTMMVWTTFQLHHYSNGQVDSFYIENSVKRNNYRSGDFSTNYWRGFLNVSLAGQKHMVTASFGYRQDVNLGGPFIRTQELYDNYGEKRALASIQFINRTKQTEATYLNRATTEKDIVKVHRQRQWLFRAELEYILGSLSNYNRDSKHRLGWHNYLAYLPSVYSEVGFILHTYTGRDYLNIRFDDIVFVGEAGLFLKFNGK